MEKIKLQPKEIVDKRFKTAWRGYNPKEVDTFLDEIIQDYESYEKNISELKSENERLIEKLNNTDTVADKHSDGDVKSVAPKQPAPIKPAPIAKPTVNVNNNSTEQPVPGTTIYDILKRLSNLERHVFGQSKGEPMNNPVNNQYHTNLSSQNVKQKRPIINSTSNLNNK